MIYACGDSGGVKSDLPISSEVEKRLVGQELLRKVDELRGARMPDVLHATGYFSQKEDGSTRLHFVQFSAAISKAKNEFSANQGEIIQQSLEIYDLVVERANIEVQKGNKKYSRGDYQGAIDDYTKAIVFTQSEPIPYFIRGNAKKELGDLKGACEDWKKAAELGDEDAAKLVQEHC